jgi:hypothetical protein
MLMKLWVMAHKRTFGDAVRFARENSNQLADF